MTDREAMKMAFEIIGVLKPENIEHKHLQGAAWDALRQALEQPEQEPVAYLNIEIEGTGGYLDWDNDIPASWYKSIPLYTAPPKREWVGLTAGEMSDIWCETTGRDWVNEDTHVYGEAIEAKLKEKNT